MIGFKKFAWGDLDENGDSEEGKPIMHGYITSQGAILTKMTILKSGN